MAKIFITGGRTIKLKQWPKLRQIFRELNLDLEILSLPYPQFLEKLESSYAVILISISEVSPNLALDAVRLGKPIILTQETGLRERLGDAVIWVDPRDEEDIKNKILWLMAENNYKIACERAQNFRFAHSWSQIASEFLALAQSL